MHSYHIGVLPDEGEGRVIEERHDPLLDEIVEGNDTGLDILVLVLETEVDDRVQGPQNEQQRHQHVQAVATRHGVALLLATLAEIRLFFIM